MSVIRPVRANLALTADRLDASFHTSPGEAAVGHLLSSDRRIDDLGNYGYADAPARFARTWAAPGELGVPYLRPYDVFDYLPIASDQLSVKRNANLDVLRLVEGDILITCSGRNLGPVAYVDGVLARFALSHDMIRFRVGDSDRFWLFAYLRSATGQALLRRGRAGSVIDHITINDVRRLPVPEFRPDEREQISSLVVRALNMRDRARTTLLNIVGATPTGANATAATRASWTVRSVALAERLDAARYHPAVAAAAEESRTLDGARLGDLAQAVLPIRYRRYYVDSENGRPILSGRQLLQADLVNLRFVSDRSFRDPAGMELREGATVFGAVGRSEGRVGQPALIGEDRARFLASNDVMRLFPREGVHPGAVWATVADLRTQIQIKSLSFGSVVDHMIPEDVETLHVAPIDMATADAVEDAWRTFSVATTLLNRAVRLVDNLLAED